MAARRPRHHQAFGRRREARRAACRTTAASISCPPSPGLGAPHWDQYARGSISGLTRGIDRGHIARAALEGIAFQVADVLSAMEADSGIKLKELRVDGGACANNLLMQFQADLLGVPVVRPAIQETTALGAAYLAGLAVGFWRNQAEIAKQWKVDHTFEPAMKSDKRDKLRAIVEQGARARQDVGRSRVEVAGNSHPTTNPGNQQNEIDSTSLTRIMTLAALFARSLACYWSRAGLGAAPAPTTRRSPRRSAKRSRRSGTSNTCSATGAASAPSWRRKASPSTSMTSAISSTDVTGSQTHHATYFGRFRASTDIDFNKLSGFDGEFFFSRHLAVRAEPLRRLSPHQHADQQHRRRGKRAHRPVLVPAGLLRQHVQGQARPGRARSTNSARPISSTSSSTTNWAMRRTRSSTRSSRSARRASRASSSGAISPTITPGLYAKAGVFTAYNNPYHPDSNGVDYVRRLRSRHGRLPFELGYKEQNTVYDGVYKLGVNWQPGRAPTPIPPPASSTTATTTSTPRWRRRSITRRWPTTAIPRT